MNVSISCSFNPLCVDFIRFQATVLWTAISFHTNGASFATFYGSDWPEWVTVTSTPTFTLAFFLIFFQGLSRRSFPYHKFLRLIHLSNNRFVCPVPALSILMLSLRLEFGPPILSIHHFSDMCCLFSAFLSLWQLPFPRCLSNYHLSALLWKLVCLALKTCLSFSETRYLPHDVRAVITFLSLMGCLFSSGQSIQIMFLYSLSPVHFLPICQVKFIRFTRFVYSAPFVPHHMSYLCHLSSAKSIHSVSVSHHFCIFLTFAPIVQKGQIAYKPVAI